MKIRFLIALTAISIPTTASAAETRLRCEGTLVPTVVGKEKPNEFHSRYYILDAEKKNLWRLVGDERKGCEDSCTLRFSETQILRTYETETSDNTTRVKLETRIDRLTGDIREILEMSTASLPSSGYRFDGKCQRISMEDRRF